MRRISPSISNVDISPAGEVRINPRGDIGRAYFLTPEQAHELARQLDINAHRIESGAFERANQALQVHRGDYGALTLDKGTKKALRRAGRGKSIAKTYIHALSVMGLAKVTGAHTMQLNSTGKNLLNHINAETNTK